MQAALLPRNKSYRFKQPHFLFAAFWVACGAVFANLIQLFSPKPPQAYENAFVERVTVTAKLPRNRRVEQLLLIGWALIALKSLLVVWAIHRWHVPFSPLWVIVPTVMFGALCTGLYLFWRE